MTTIEDKIKFFSKIVFDKVQEEQQKDIDKFNKEKEERIKKEKEKLELKKKEAIKEINKKAQLKANELIAREKVESHQEVLKLRQKLLDETLNGLKDKLIEFTNDEGYKEVFLTIVRNTINKLDEGSYTLYLTKKDKTAYEDEVYKIIRENHKVKINVEETDDNIIGGIFMLSDDKKIRIDNTLYSSLIDMKQFIGAKLAEKIG